MGLPEGGRPSKQKGAGLSSKGSRTLWCGPVQAAEDEDGEAGRGQPGIRVGPVFSRGLVWFCV